jgi:putative MATE family efflux protein
VAEATLNLTTDPIPQLVRRIAMPASIGFFFNTMFNFVDTYCAGLLGTDALAALSLSFPVFFILLSAGSGLSQGTTALMANAIGAQDQPTARHFFAQAIFLAVFGGLGISALGYAAAPSLFDLLGARGSYLSTALAYMNVIMAGGVFFILQMTLNSALNAQGDTKLYRNVLILGFCANCVLNPVLMYGWLGLPAMGVAGLGLATVLIQLGGACVMWWVISRRGLFAGLPLSLFKPEPALLGRLIRQAVPAGLNMLTVALGIFVITWFVKHFGKEAVAAYGIATRIEQVVLLPTIGLNFAVLGLVGQNHGAGLPQRVRAAWLTCIQYGVVLMLAGGLLVFALRYQAMRLFSEDPTVIQLGADYLITAALTLAAYPILFITVFLMQGLKRPAYGLWVGLYRQIAAPLLVFHALAFSLGWGLWGIWWGVFLVTWSAALFALWWGARTVRCQESK